MAPADERQRIIAKLKELEAKAQRILDYMDPQTGRFAASGWSTMQELLRRLKETLRAEAKRKDFSAMEQIYYAPVVQEAEARLTIRINSRPDGKWHDQLYDTRFTLSHARTGLEKNR